MTNVLNTQDTITHIAQPSDSRCQWWQGEFLNDLDVKHLEEKSPIKMFKRGADLELTPGTMLIDSEALHHRHNRGFAVNFGLVTNDRVKWVVPNMKMKMLIKEKGHKDLMKGSGDVAACVRIALYLRRQENILEAFEELSKLDN